MPGSKYRPLHEFLKSLDEQERRMSFTEIERLIGQQLPPSARKHSPWWANYRSSSSRQSWAWLDAGWETCDLDFEAESVNFTRR